MIRAILFLSCSLVIIAGISPTFADSVNAKTRCQPAYAQCVVRGNRALQASLQKCQADNPNDPSQMKACADRADLDGKGATGVCRQNFCAVSQRR
jgi:hypothetical protein